PIPPPHRSGPARGSRPPSMVGRFTGGVILLLLLGLLLGRLLFGGAGKEPGGSSPAVKASGVNAPQPREGPAPASPDAPEITNSIGMKLVLIPAGKFRMGSPPDEAGRSADEGPEHEVEITCPFYMGVYEVTQQEYEQVMGENPSSF